MIEVTELFDLDRSCAICRKQLCFHGQREITGCNIKCVRCEVEIVTINGSTEIPTYCLPMYEGKVNFSSDVYSRVCKECHDEHACTCPKECDCQNPAPDDWNGSHGVFHYSELCPIHNFRPMPEDDCPVHGEGQIILYDKYHPGQMTLPFINHAG